MTAEFREVVAEAERKVKELRQCAPVSISDAKKFPAVPGVYVISRGERNLYAGLAGNLKRRLSQHANGRQIQSAFTLKLTAHKFRKTNKKPVSLSKLRANKQFIRSYAGTAEQVKRMKARYVKAESARLRIVLEVLAGMAFKTKWNDFNVKTGS